MPVPPGIVRFAGAISVTLVQDQEDSKNALPGRRAVSVRGDMSWPHDDPRARNPNPDAQGK